MSNLILLLKGLVEFFYILADFLSNRSIPIPHSAFSDITPIEWSAAPGYSFVRVEIYVFNPSFAGGVGDGATFFFLCYLTGVEQLLSKIFCLSNLSPFLVLWLEKQAWFCFYFSSCTYWCFQFASILSFGSEIYEAREKFRGLTIMSFLEF